MAVIFSNVFCSVIFFLSLLPEERNISCVNENEVKKCNPHFFSPRKFRNSLGFKGDSKFQAFDAQKSRDFKEKTVSLQLTGNFGKKSWHFCKERQKKVRENFSESTWPKRHKRQISNRVVIYSP